MTLEKEIFAYSQAQARFTRFSERGTYYTGRRTGTGANDVTMAGAPPGQFWVRSADLSRDELPAYGQWWRANDRVICEYNQAGELVLIGPDWTGGLTNAAALAAGGMTVIGDVSYVDITALNLRPLKLTLSESGGLTVTIRAYAALGIDKQDFVMTVPGTASKRAWCAVVFNPRSRTFSQVTGTLRDSTETLLESNQYTDLAIPTGSIVAGTVRLTNGQTTIAAADFGDFRELWTPRLPAGNYTGTTAPTTGDDSTAGYIVGSQWFDITGDAAYVCLDASAGAAVWARIDNTSAGLMSSFTLAGDSGTPQTIVDANTLTIEGGTAVNTVAGATDKVTVNFDLTELTNENTVDGATDYIVFFDASVGGGTGAHRKTLIDNLPSGGGAGTLTVKEADGTPLVNNVDTIVVTNGTLTDDGGGQVTISTGGGGGGGSNVFNWQNFR